MKKNNKKFSSITSQLRKSSILSLAMYIIFAVGVSDYLKKSLGFEDIERYSFFVLLLIVLTEANSRVNFQNSNGRLRVPFIVIPLFVAYFVFWYERSFGKFDAGSLVFHFWQGFGGGAEKTVVKHAARHFILFVLISISFIYIFNKYKLRRRVDLFLSILVLSITPIFMLSIGYTKSLFLDGSLKQEYRLVNSIVKKADVETKNLVIIYVESTERTFQEIQNGDAVFSDMKWIASQGHEFIGLSQVANTGWSIAGLVASQCGVPLQPSSSFRRVTFLSGSTFMQNSTCLGDVLKEHNYWLSYVSGADLSFAGTATFLKEHGYTEVIDLSVLKGVDQNYLNYWGLYDDTLFQIAEIKLDELVFAGKPFVMSVATIGGHSPDGHPTRECIDKFGTETIPSIMQAVRCTGYHVREFIEKIRDKGLLDDTVVVVISDHLVMKTSVSNELDKHERMNYFSALGGEIVPASSYKLSAMFDVFPTLLELMGFELVDDRAGLGTSLLSKQPSLLEKFGKTDLDTMITYDRDLSDFLWERPAIIPEM